MTLRGDDDSGTAAAVDEEFCGGMGESARLVAWIDGRGCNVPVGDSSFFGWTNGDDDSAAV